MDLVFGDSEGTQISDDVSGDREGTQISDSDSDSDAEGNDAIVHEEEDYTESDNHDDCDFLKTPNSLLMLKCNLLYKKICQILMYILWKPRRAISPH